MCLEMKPFCEVVQYEDEGGVLRLAGLGVYDVHDMDICWRLDGHRRICQCIGDCRRLPR